LIAETTLTSLAQFRRSPFVAVLVIVAFFATLLPPRPAQADASSAAPTPESSASIDAMLGGNPASLSVAQGGNGQANAVASATVDSLSGALSAAIPIELPNARGAVQPQLGLQYSSNAGRGLGGQGWSLALPSIERH